VLSFYKNFITQSPTQAQAKTPEFSDDKYRTRYEDFEANILVLQDATTLARDEAKLKQEVEQLKDNANDIVKWEIRLSKEEEKVTSALETYQLVKDVPKEKYTMRDKLKQNVKRWSNTLPALRPGKNKDKYDNWQNRRTRENLDAARNELNAILDEIDELEEKANKAKTELESAEKQVKLTKDHITDIQNSMKSDFDEKATEIILEKYKTYLLEATIQLQKVRATEALSGEQDKVAEKSTAAPPTTDAVQKAKEDAKAAQRAKQEKERLSDLVTSLQTQRNELEKEKEIFEAATKNIGESIEELGAYEGELQSIYTEVITLVNNLKALSTEIKNCEEETQKEYNVAMTDGMITREQDCVKKLKECQTKIEEFRIMQPKINMAVEAMEPSIQKIGKYINDLQNIKNEVTASSSMPNEVKNFLDSLLEEQNKRKTLLSEVQKIGTTARKEVDSFKENSNFILLNLKENLQLEYNGFLAAIESYKLKKSAEEAQAAAEVAKEAMEAADATEKEKLKTEAEELKTIAAEKAQVAEAASKAAAEARRVKVVPRRGSSPSILSSLTTVNTFSKNEDNYHTLLTMDLSSQVSVDVKALNFGKSLYYQIPVMTQLIRFLHHLWRFKTYVNNDKINEDKIFQEIENDAKVFVQNLMDSPDSISMLAPLPPLDAKKSISGDNLRSCKRLLLNFKDTHIDEGLGKLVENGLLRESVVGWYMTTKHETFILGVILEELLTS
jgi:chromosome segregation ATPase